MSLAQTTYVERDNSFEKLRAQTVQMTNQKVLEYKSENKKLYLQPKMENGEDSVRGFKAYVLTGII